jgi:glycerol-3-phosphate dehydrogenase
VERFEVAVIGAGLIGAAVAYDLATAGVKVVVLEAERELAAGASRSNSGVVHTGFDSEPGTFETQMIRSQAGRWREVFDALGVPYREVGALLTAVDDEQASSLAEIAERAALNGVEVDLLDGAEARGLEPRTLATAGLLVPGESITDPYEVVRRMLATGSETRLRWPVSRVEPDGEGAMVLGPAGEVAANFVVNCAGLFGDEIAGDGSFSIEPRRGEFIVFGKGTADLVSRILLPVPSKRTKGVLVFPTLYGHLCAGPSAVDQESKDDWRPREEGLDYVRERAARLLPEVRHLERTDAWAGLRPSGRPKNYVVGWSGRVRALLNVAAIRSTGLSACLGLSEHVTGLLAVRGLELGKRRKSVSSPNFADDPPRPWWERLNALRGVSRA